jgi:hypothetical protein
MGYLAGYPEALQKQARKLLESARLGEVLVRRYPKAHDWRGDRALFEPSQGTVRDPQRDECSAKRHQSTLT